MKWLLLLPILILMGCSANISKPDDTEGEATQSPSSDEMTLTVTEASETIYFAGGCFWGVEAYYDRLPGVIATTSGYANGHTKNPTYRDVVGGDTGYAETVKVEYNPHIISLETLVAAYFRIIDPFTINRQGNDIGHQYRTGIYTTSDADADRVQAVYAREQKKHDRNFAVALESLTAFTDAEDYHQDYLIKNPYGYCHIDLDLAELPLYPGRYETPSDSELEKALSALSYDVTRNRMTEPAFQNEYHDNYEPGLYVDITNGQPLFSSREKFDSGTGWPSFTMPITPDAVSFVADHALFTPRVEVVAKESGSHLGHVFEDGPFEKGGLRYCMNSAAMRFIPINEMEKEGYGELIPWIE